MAAESSTLRRIWHDHGLSIVLVFLFAVTLAGQTLAGWRVYNEEQLAHGEPPVGALSYMGTSQFWFESFQNWQSEFLAIAAMVVLSIFLRQRGSPESKPVDAPTWDTGD